MAILDDKNYKTTNKILITNKTLAGKKNKQ